jgi:hypothetical protein
MIGAGPAAFGKVSSTPNSQRQIEFGMKMIFKPQGSFTEPPHE